MRRWLLLALALPACRSEATLGGEALACDPSPCPADMRCVRNACIFNSPPVVDALGALSLVAGQVVDVMATATDADGDDIDFEWTQQEGPTVLPAPVLDASLTVTLPTDGTYVFSVVANDSFDDGTPGVLTVTASNEPPAVEPFALLLAETGVPTTVTAVTSDADGHPVTLSWEQRGGPDLGLGVVSGPTLAITLNALGEHRFDVTPNDGFVDGSIESLQIVGVPDFDVVYVSDASRDTSPTCGGFDSPCGTLTAGLSAARAVAPPITTLYLAAPTASDAYDHCLDLSGSEVVRGGFGAGTFVFDPDLRAATVIACDQELGHRLTDAAGVEDLTLRSTFEGTPVDAVIAVRLVGGSPTLTRVDVEAGVCTTACNSTGVQIDGGTAVLTGVEARARDVGFGVLESYVGILALRGDVLVRGDVPASPPPTTARTLNDGIRGGVTLNLPVNGASVGIGSGAGRLVVESMLVRGGLGHEIVGVAANGSDLELRRSLIDFTGFGSTTITGVRVDACTEPEWPCVCLGMSCPGTTYESQLIAIDNTLVLRSPAAGEGPVPCAGLGFGVRSQRRGNVIEGNDVTLIRDFSASAGIAVQSALAPMSMLDPPDRIHDNDVRVEQGRVDLLCPVITGLEATASGGVSGVVASGQGSEVTLNRVSVGAHTASVYGLLLEGVDAAVVADNDVIVGDFAVGPSPTPFAYGASLSKSLGTTPAVFERNRITVGPQPARGIALELTDATPWLVRNNFLHGGGAVHTGGVWVSGKSDPVWPKLIHNTIHAGGAAGRTLSSRGVILGDSGEDGQAPGATLGNNLIDAGEGSGRRILLETLSRFPASLQGNFAQRVGTSGPASPGHIARRAVAGAVATIPPWVIVLEGSGELVGLAGDNADLYQTMVHPIPGAPLTAWSGATSLGSFYVVGLADAVATTRMVQGRAAGFVAYPTEDAAGVTHTPSSAVVAPADHDFPADAVFIEAPAVSSDPASVWTMPGDLVQGYGRAQPLDPAILNPTHLVPMFDGANLLVIDQPLPSQMVDDVIVHAYPNGISTSLAGYLPNGTASNVTFATSVHLGEFVNTGPPDVILIADDEVRVLTDGVFSRDPISFFNRPLLSDACTPAGAVPVSATAGWSFDENVPYLWVMCDDGFIEANRYNLLTGNFTFMWRQNVGLPDEWLWQSSVAGDFLVMTSRTTHQAALWGYAPVTNNFVFVELLDIDSEIAFRDITTPTAPELDFDFTDLPGAAGMSLQGTACELELRATGMGTSLDLTGPMNPCVDAGVDLGADATVDDVDGIDTRTDGVADVGADER